MCEDCLSSDEESNPDDPDYVPNSNLSDIEDQASHSQTAQPPPDNINNYDNEENNEEESIQPNEERNIIEDQNMYAQEKEGETVEQPK